MDNLQLIRNTYRKNVRWPAASHEIRVKTEDYPIDQKVVVFDSDELPYLSLALLDKHIDSLQEPDT